MNDEIQITPNPDDRNGVLVFLPEVDYLDTQVWSASVGISLTALRDLRDVITGHLVVARSGPDAAERSRVETIRCTCRFDAALERHHRPWCDTFDMEAGRPKILSPETDEERELREDREVTERDHAAGDHRYCGVTCETEFPSDILRNGILYRAIPGSKTMLDELLRRAARDGFEKPVSILHTCENCDGISPDTCLMNPARSAAVEEQKSHPSDLEKQRADLLEAMSGVSEERWCAGWMADLERLLYAEGGIWETIGRSIGWPTGNYDEWTWLTWDEAGEFFKNEKPPKEV